MIKEVFHLSLKKYVYCSKCYYPQIKREDDDSYKKLIEENFDFEGIWKKQLIKIIEEEPKLSDDWDKLYSKYNLQSIRLM